LCAVVTCGASWNHDAPRLPRKRLGSFMGMVPGGSRCYQRGDVFLRALRHVATTPQQYDVASKDGLWGFKGKGSEMCCRRGEKLLPSMDSGATVYKRRCYDPPPGGGATDGKINWYQPLPGVMPAPSGGATSTSGVAASARQCFYRCSTMVLPAIGRRPMEVLQTRGSLLRAPDGGAASTNRRCCHR
jgi:hypothetical protein